MRTFLLIASTFLPWALASKKPSMIVKATEPQDRLSPAKQADNLKTSLMPRIDEKTSTIFSAIANGTVDDLDDAVEAAGGYAKFLTANFSLLYYAAANQKLVIFKHLISKGFSVDPIVPGLSMPIYRFIITMKSNPIRDRMLRIAYETSDRMLEDYYKPKFKKTGWDSDAAEAMQQNDFIYIDRILNRHKAHPDNVITNQGLMIHSAVLNDCPECVKLVIAAGANPNHPYVGSELLRSSVIGEEGEIITDWTPLMMAIAKGNMRVIEALMESPNLQVCKGLPHDQFHNARNLARKWPNSAIKFELLKMLKARPADAPILESWIKGIALEHLTMKFALSKSNRKLVEFLLHNCVDEIDPEWIKYSIAHSSVECLEILCCESGSSVSSLDLDSFLQAKDPEHDQKEVIIRKLNGER